MAMRTVARRLVNPTGESLFARSVMRRRMSDGRILGEEEKAAENVYIKKMEKEKLEKLARKGFTEEEARKAVEGHPDALPEAVKVINTSADKETNYAVIAGIVGAVAIGYWYFSSSSSAKKEKDEKE